MLDAGGRPFFRQLLVSGDANPPIAIEACIARRRRRTLLVPPTLHEPGPLPDSDAVLAEREPRYACTQDAVEGLEQLNGELRACGASEGGLWIAA